jgi:hypothetical protein
VLGDARTNSSWEPDVAAYVHYICVLMEREGWPVDRSETMVRALVEADDPELALERWLVDWSCRLREQDEEKAAWFAELARQVLVVINKSHATPHPQPGRAEAESP